MDLGLTQGAVATKIGVIEASVWNWEDGRVEPELRYLPAILAFLGGDPRPEPKTMGARLVRFRTARGWSQKRLAEELKVDPSTLARWERGEIQPRGAFRERVSVLLATGRDLT